MLSLSQRRKHAQSLSNNRRTRRFITPELHNHDIGAASEAIVFEAIATTALHVSRTCQVDCKCFAASPRLGNRFRRCTYNNHVCAPVRSCVDYDNASPFLSCQNCGSSSIHQVSPQAHCGSIFLLAIEFQLQSLVSHV